MKTNTFFQHIPVAHLRHGIKTGLASLLSYEASRSLGLPYAFWAVISTVIVMQVYVADSVKMCLYRFFGTTMGAGIGIFAIWAFPAGDLWNDVAIVLTLGFCGFMTRYSPRYRMAAITVSVVFVGSFGVPTDERILYALFRVLEITLGVGIAFLVSVLVFPERLEKHLAERLSSQKTQAAILCRDLTAAFVYGEMRPPLKALQELFAQIRSNRASLSGITHHELLFARRQRGHTLESSIGRLERTGDHLAVMAHALENEALLKERFHMETELLALSEACALTLEQMRDTPAVVDCRDLHEALIACDARLLALRHQGATFRFDLDMLAGFYEFYSALKSLALDLVSGNAGPFGTLSSETPDP
ncbi:FUSC family protein [Desulfoluna sp.]|uniref:FUSC family protein n=1 Tax=Desulfoluna sp. TaxID=2045199 RepID=UPI00261D9C10|nr:FUSC family protein [Desulfoluna sp.]